MKTAHLEETGAILRAGMTPTDIMHIRGDFEGYCREASLLAARFVVRSSEAHSVDDLCQTVYDLVTGRLYQNLVRILLTTECDGIKDPENKQIQSLIRHSWKLELERERGRSGPDHLLPVLFQTPAKIVAVGAPSHVFLPRVARMLHTEAVMPPHAGVANAVGAVTGGFSAVTEVTVTPGRYGEREICEVLTAEERKQFDVPEDAFAYAREAGRAEAEARAREQGAVGPLTITDERIHKEGVHRYGTSWLMDILRFRASAKA